MPNKPYGTSVPMCASCMTRCNMSYAEIDVRLGHRASVARLRSHFIRLKVEDIKFWFPPRKLGGCHNDYQGLYAAGSSAGHGPKKEGVKMRIYGRMFDGTDQNSVIDEIAQAFWKMERKVFGPHQWERFERCGYKPVREFIERPTRPIQILL